MCPTKIYLLKIDTGLFPRRTGPPDLATLFAYRQSHFAKPFLCIRNLLIDGRTSRIGLGFLGGFTFWRTFVFDSLLGGGDEIVEIPHGNQVSYTHNAVEDFLCSKTFA